MRIVSATITNFRSLVSATVAFGAYTVVVGTNNSGKSNIVDALLTFWGKRSFEMQRDRPRMKTLGQAVSDAWIEAEFLLTDDEHAALKDEYRIGSNHLRIRHTFISGGVLKDKVSAYAIGADGKIALSDNEFYGWTDTARLGVIVAIPALSKLDDHLKMTGTTALNQMLAPIIKDLFAAADDPVLRKAAEDMAASVTAMGDHVRKTAGEIEHAINVDLGSWGLTFGVGTESPDAKKLLTDSISHRIMDPHVADDQPASSFGQGFQRHMVYVLLKLRATRLAKKVKADEPVKQAKPKKGKLPDEPASEPKKVFAPSFFLLLFEEPEVFLHPSQLDALHRALLGLTDDSSQVVITTHSPQMASRNIEDLTAFARVVRTGGVTTVHQVCKTRLQEILDANTNEVARWKATAGFQKTIHADDLTMEMESVKYAIWMNPIRAASFFADRVLLVEGPTEVALLGWMADKQLLGTKMEGVVVVDALGKFNMHRFMALFSDLGICHAVLHDEDGGAYATTVDATISGARNAKTIGITAITADIERFLGLPKCKDKHRKPQSLMHNISLGRVSADRFKALADTLDALMTPTA